MAAAEIGSALSGSASTGFETDMKAIEASILLQRTIPATTRIDRVERESGSQSITSLELDSSRDIDRNLRDLTEMEVKYLLPAECVPVRVFQAAAMHRFLPSRLAR